MQVRFHVVTVLHPGGERLPILLDAERQPVPWINAYLIKHLRPRLSVNSLIKTLRALGYMWAWALAEAFPLETRLVSGEGLSQDEIVSQLYPWLRRNFQTTRKVRKLIVSPSTVAFRLNVVSQCVRWHLECAIFAMPVGSPEIREMRERLTFIERSFSTAGRVRVESSTHATPLSTDQQQRLLRICHPDSRENPWKKPYRQRNFLIVLMMAMLGVRRGELLKLRVSDCHLSRAIPEIRVQRSPDDPSDPRINEPQVKTESRLLPCNTSLARYLNDYICTTRRNIPGAGRSPFLFLSRGGQPMSLARVNGLLDQIAIVHPEFEGLHPHCLRSTCATNFREAGLRNGLDEERIDKDMMYFFGWRSADSVMPYIDAAIRRESCEISLSYQAASLGRSIFRSDA
ncbi:MULTISPECIES: tyrosine-type recombinase/integrase [Burkholderia]|uniref:Tyrosine-based site-specific recombinase CMGI-7 n=1 Tax=Burkholderia ubonensis TaxID=101571 RepID=A0A1B4LFG1_9BURK|nr:MULTISPECIES: site-specific integrase [Burkholderia]AOJ75920.1 tyrosine-based site-specific recombinase CMGI-7 [Burkholderia ubonensis]AOK11117.1 tyrosine-based site-specific recombinase CMGI-7 [Burkholderia vietnamiensis]RQM58080.1 site-specific integrase [Burkholderia vietnamiensis]CAG9190106.1 Tyrosine-based site-specific recombinase CMGI-7 [Burkholderia vietnamiensis]